MLEKRFSRCLSGEFFFGVCVAGTGALYDFKFAKFNCQALGQLENRQGISFEQRRVLVFKAIG